MLNHIKLNVDEFVALKFDYEEWLIDRLQEVRAMVLIFVNKINKISDMVMIGNCIHTFNLTNEDLMHSLECGDIFENRIAKLQVE